MIWAVEVPQVIETCNDALVMTYFRDYPLTEYIRTVINVFSVIINQIEMILEEENRESETINTEIHKEIDLLEEELLSLKHADDFFIQRDKYIAPQIFQEYRQVLLTQIQNGEIEK